MNKKLTLSLDPKTYDRLLALCQGDENNLAPRAAQILAKHLTPDPAPGPADLEEYLKNSSSGSRTYGVKGQGW